MLGKNDQPKSSRREAQIGRRRSMIVEFLEDRRLLAASIEPMHLAHEHGPAGADVPFGVFSAEEIEAFENVPFDTNLSTKTPPLGSDAQPPTSQGSFSEAPTFLMIDDGFCRPGITGGLDLSSFELGALGPGAGEGDEDAGSVVTIVLDFKEPGQGDTSDIFGNVISSFDVTSYGFAAGDFDSIANAVLTEVENDFFSELVGTVAGPPGKELAIDFVIGDIGTPPAGASEYYFVQIGTGESGPHSGGTLGVAGGSVVRTSAGVGPNAGIQIGDVVASVFTDAIVTLGSLTPTNALTSGNLTFTANAISGTTSHEIAHTASLSHINKAGSVQPTAGRSPIMGTGAIDLPNNDRIGNREFSLSGFDGQNGGVQRFHVQQLVDALGLRDRDAVTITPPVDGLIVSEDGMTDNYTVQLTTTPSGPVQVRITADSQTRLSVDGTNFSSVVVLNLTNTTPQTITVAAVDDFVLEGNHISTLTHRISASADPDYPVGNLSDLEVIVFDNEATLIDPLVEVEPLGSEIYQWQGSGDIDIAPHSVYYSVTLDGFQTISAAVVPDSTLQPIVDVLSPDGFLLRSVTAPAIGESAIVQEVPAAESGTYVIRVSSTASLGSFMIDVGINTTLENEAFGGNFNGSILTAQPIQTFAMAGIRSSERGAVLGDSNAHPQVVFFDDFPTTTFNPALWELPTTAISDDLGTAEPSPAFSAHFDGDPDGGDILQSVVLDLSGSTSAELSYFLQKGGGNNMPEAGDDLFIEYLNSSGVWTELKRHFGFSTDTVTYALNTLQFPADALHANFQFRFQNTATIGFFDDWFVDDVTVTSFDQDDWYSFTVDDGQDISLVFDTLDTAVSGVLELYDSAATLLASGIGADNFTQSIQSYIDQTTDSIANTYFARIVAPSDPYSLMVILDGVFDAELNSTFDQVQDLYGTTEAWGHVEAGSGSGGLNLINSFPGITATGFIPPDPTLGVGPSHVVAAVNTDVAIFDKSSGAQLFRQNMSGAGGFFGSAGATTTVFDPWIIWDDDSQRFFVIGIDLASATESNLFVAVSQDSTPTGGNDWFKYKIDLTHDPTGTGLGTGAHFPDYEKMGVNDDALFVSGNYFAIGAGNGVYAGITAIEKAPLLTGGAANILYEEHFSGFSVFPLNQFNSGSTQYFAEELNSTTIRVHAVTDVLTAPTRTTFNLTVPAFNSPVNVPQLGGGTPINAVGSRIMTGVWRDGSAWFAHGITDPAIGDGENVVRWYEVSTNDFPNANPTLVQVGNVDPGPGVHAWMPAIAVNGAGDMALGFSTGGPNQFASAAATGRLASDPAGFTNIPVFEYAVGLANYVANDGSGRNRWGDYSGMAVDPSDDTTFWAFNEFASTGNRWNTRVAAFQLDTVGEADFYSFDAVAGDTITVSSRTPFDGPNFPTNLLDPAIEIFDPSGNVVASDDNSAADGRNARLIFNVTETGTYRVRVFSNVGAAGGYLLSVVGSTGGDAAPFILDTDPDNFQTVPTFPVVYSVHFSEGVDLSTLQPSDLLINNIPAVDYVVLAGNMVDFIIDPSVNVGDGVYDVFMSASSFTDLQGNEMDADFVAQFELDTTGPVITATSWNGQSLLADKTLSPGPLVFTADLSEELFLLASARRGPFTPGADDVILEETSTGTIFTPSSVSFDNVSKQFRANFDQTLFEGSYRLTLLSGDSSFEDEVGNDLDGEAIGGNPDGTTTGDGTAGGNYVLEFYVDQASPSLNAAVRLPALGSAVSTSDLNVGAISNPTDTDEFTFFAEKGQTVSVIADSLTATGILSLEILGLTPTYNSPAVGALSVIPPTVIPAAGQYTLRISADDTVQYSFQLLNNATSERGFGDTSDTLTMPFDAASSELATALFTVLGSTQAVAPTQFIRTNDPASFIDISGTGTALNLGDDEFANIQTTVGNSVFPAGNVSLSNNGGIIAGADAFLDFTNTPLPSNGFGNALLPYWDDIFNTSGSVFWQEVPVGGINTLIVQWENRPHISTGVPGTFQLQLFESGPILVRYAYEDVDFGDVFFNNGASATIGLQRDTNNAIQFSFNTASIVNGDRLDLLAGSSDIDSYSLDLSSYVGKPIDVMLTAIDGTNLGFQTLELVDPNGVVIATGSSSPLGPNATNIDLGILDFVVPDIGNNIYTLNFISDTTAQYSLSVLVGSAFNIESNQTSLDTLRQIGIDKPGLGFISGFGGALEPDNFTNGQVLDTVIPRVTLSNAMTGGSIFAAEASFVAPTGTLVFAPGVGQAAGFREDVNGLRADFDSPVDFVSIDAGSDDNADISRLRAFDINGNLLAEVISGSLPADQSETLTINRPTADIAFVIAGGFNGDVAPLDNLQFAFSGDPVDFYQIALEAGETVYIGTDTVMSDPLFAPINSLNPELTILDTDGSTILASDLDGYDGRNAEVVFTAPAAGNYFVRVGATSGFGEYIVRVYQQRPSVESVVVNDGSVSRSTITSVTVHFTEELDHAALQNAFTLTNRTTGEAVENLIVTPQDLNGKTSVVLTFGSGLSVRDRAGIGVFGNALANGNYQLDIAASQIISKATSVVMAANHEFGAQEADEFYAYFGDVTGDRFVNFIDLAVLRGSYLKRDGELNFDANLDYTGDAFVNFLDLAQFRGQYLKRLDFN